MEKMYTHTTATFTSANGETVNFQDFFESIRKSTEIYGKTGGRDLLKEDLEDLFQDSVVKVLTSIDWYDSSKSKPQSRGARAAFSAQCDAYKRHCRRVARFEHPLVRHKSDDEVRESFFDGFPSCFDADREIESKEAEAIICKAIDSLPKIVQIVIVHSAYDNLPPRDIAKRLGCKASDVYRILFRARKALAKKLGPEFLGEYGIAC